MASFFHVYGIGNLTRDPELTYTPAGVPVCKFGMAANRRFTGAGGEKKEEVTFIDCTAWQKTAETIAQYLKKGTRIHIEGRLSFNAWQSEDGQRRSKLEVTVERFSFLDKKPGNGNGGQQESGEEEGPQ